MQVLDVVAERGELHGAGEELQQAGQVAAGRALAERDRNPQNLLPARGQRLLQRYPQRLKPQGAEPVDVADDQAPLALKQFAERPRHPVVITGFGGVQHVERAGRVAAPADSPQQRQLAGSGLAARAIRPRRRPPPPDGSRAATADRSPPGRARICAAASRSPHPPPSGWPARSASHAPRRQRAAACPSRAGGGSASARWPRWAARHPPQQGGRRPAPGLHGRGARPGRRGRACPAPGRSSAPCRW